MDADNSSNNYGGHRSVSRRGVPAATHRGHSPIPAARKPRKEVEMRPLMASKAENGNGPSPTNLSVETKQFADHWLGAMIKLNAKRAEKHAYNLRANFKSKKGFHVQIPKRMLFYTVLVFLVLPLILFLYKENHIHDHDPDYHIAKMGGNHSSAYYYKEGSKRDEAGDKQHNHDNLRGAGLGHHGNKQHHNSLSQLLGGGETVLPKTNATETAKEFPGVGSPLNPKKVPPLETGGDAIFGNTFPMLGDKAKEEGQLESPPQSEVTETESEVSETESEDSQKPVSQAAQKQQHSPVGSKNVTTTTKPATEIAAKDAPSSGGLLESIAEATTTPLVHAITNFYSTAETGTPDLPTSPEEDFLSKPSGVFVDEQINRLPQQAANSTSAIQASNTTQSVTEPSADVQRRRRRRRRLLHNNYTKTLTVAATKTTVRRRPPHNNYTKTTTTASKM